MVASGRGSGGMGEKVKGLRSTNWQLQNRQGGLENKRKK